MKNDKKILLAINFYSSQQIGKYTTPAANCSA